MFILSHNTFSLHMTPPIFHVTPVPSKPSFSYTPSPFFIIRLYSRIISPYTLQQMRCCKSAIAVSDGGSRQTNEDRAKEKKGSPGGSAARRGGNGRQVSSRSGDHLAGGIPHSPLHYLCGIIYGASLAPAGHGHWSKGAPSERETDRDSGAHWFLIPTIKQYR